MSIFIRVKTLKTIAGFLSICLIFFGGLQLKDFFNPQTAMSTGLTEENQDVIGEGLFGTNNDEKEDAAVQVKPTIADRVYNYRMARALARSQSLELLESIIQDESAGEVQRQQARTELLAKTRQAEAEVECEGALTAKGFEDVLVTIQGKAVTIMMTTDVLQPEELLQISDMVCRITNCSEEDIILIPH